VAGGWTVRVERAPEAAVSPATLMRLEHARAALPRACLGLVVVAEGVERQDQLALVRGVGRALGQGWLWARPMPIGDVGTLLGP
jgi:predicted signal transduction protein with EAL and GGDEF domain